MNQQIHLQKVLSSFDSVYTPLITCQILFLVLFLLFLFIQIFRVAKRLVFLQTNAVIGEDQPSERDQTTFIKVIYTVQHFTLVRIPIILVIIANIAVLQFSVLMTIISYVLVALLLTQQILSTNNIHEWIILVIEVINKIIAIGLFLNLIVFISNQ